MECHDKTKTLTLSEFMARYIDPLVVKSVIDPAVTAHAYGIELKPMSRVEKAKFAVRNRRDEWRERLALWIAPWLESGD